MIRDAYLALLLGVVTALSRIPFAAQRLWEWDSVLYARALEIGFHVDDTLATSRPHPPGYIFYVATAAIGRAIGLDSNTALVVVSILASGLAATSLYLLCRRFAGQGLSLLLTAAFAADPLLWLHSEVAMPYVLLAPVGTVIVLAFLAVRRGPTGPLAAASFLFGALAGFRQDLLLFLFPLWLWVLAPASGRARVASLLALSAGCLLWFVPSAALSDGPIEYVARTYRQLVGLSGVSANASRSIAVNVVLVGDALAWALLGLAFVLPVLALAGALARIRRTRRDDEREHKTWFFALWLLPPLLFYVFVHVGEWGIVIALVPGLYVLLAWLLRPIVPRLAPPARVLGALLIIANAVLGAALFVLGSDPVFSAASLAAHDRATDAKTSYIREHFPRESTVILAGAEVLVARYYLPGYVIWYADHTADATYTRTLTQDVILVVYEPRAHPPLPISFEPFEAAPGVMLERARLSLREISLPGVDIDAERR